MNLTRYFSFVLMKDGGDDGNKDNNQTQVVERTDVGDVTDKMTEERGKEEERQKAEEEKKKAEEEVDENEEEKEEDKEEGKEEENEEENEEESGKNIAGEQSDCLMDGSDNDDILTVMVQRCTYHDRPSNSLCMVNNLTDLVQCTNYICFACLDERASVCEKIPELRQYRNYLCGGCFERVEERFQESRKALPCLDIEGELLDTQKMDEVQLG